MSQSEKQPTEKLVEELDGYIERLDDGSGKKEGLEIARAAVVDHLEVDS